VIVSSGFASSIHNFDNCTPSQKVRIHTSEGDKRRVVSAPS
jgi:hypothetical protein